MVNTDSSITVQTSVQSLIEPHETEIKAIEAKEQARIDTHRAVLDRIAAMPVGVTTSDEARARLVELENISVSGLEEFQQAGEARRVEAQERLEELLSSLLAQEAKRAELEASRAEKARREEEDRINREILRRQQLAAQSVQSAVAISFMFF